MYHMRGGTGKCCRTKSVAHRDCESALTRAELLVTSVLSIGCSPSGWDWS